MCAAHVVCLQIVYAAKSKSTYNVELNRVEVEGPFLLAKAMMVCILHCMQNRVTYGIHNITHVAPDIQLANVPHSMAHSLLLNAGCAK